MDLTYEQVRALESARHLAENGVPIFIAKPAKDASGNWVSDGGTGGTGYKIPPAWQFTKADPSVIDKWEPGQALCAVTGYTVDLFDVDPRSGGLESVTALHEQQCVPRSYGRAATPSGGTHDFIAALGVRSLDKVLPGVDVKSGTPDGKGRGFAFIAPTVKVSKATGALVEYRWDIRPELAPLVLIGGDDSGERLRELIQERHAPATEPTVSYDGPDYKKMSPTEREWADAYQSAELTRWLELLTEAQDWPEGETDEKGRGWEALTRDFAWSVARLAATPWVALDAEDAQEEFNRILPDALASNPKCAGKWSDALVDKAAEKPVGQPPWREFEGLEIPADPSSMSTVPKSLEDGLLVLWVAHKGLAGNWAWSSGRGWLMWDGRRWAERHVNDVTEAVRAVFQEVNVRLLENKEMSAKKRAMYVKLLDGRKIRAIVALLGGAARVMDETFDRHKDLLNCGNGIVDLRTGACSPHDRKFFMTKITHTNYEPNSTHPDWDQTLAALDAEVIDWLQVKIGNAATGYPSSDHVVPICQGSGSNGKTTFLNALFAALGDYMVKVPDKLLNSGAGDHPTELTQLMGTRVAVIDETPEEGKLNPQRVKALTGQDHLTARRVYKDSVTWTATHSLFVMTNHLPSFSASDDAIWRRLRLVKFEKKFERNDSFALRVAEGGGGRAEAALRWIVEGAKRWYAEDKRVPEPPPTILKATDEWRAEIDSIMGYFTDRIIYDPDSCLLIKDMWEDMNDWMVSRGNHKWSERLFSTRLVGHKVYRENRLLRKQVSRPPDNLVPLFGTSKDMAARPTVLFGVRWRTEDDD